uniref:Uncharacterized protein n=1 Tax=Parascaris univalens TaxID=6257 RepID=A0A915CKM2_PARUN
PPLNSVKFVQLCFPVSSVLLQYRDFMYEEIDDNATNRDNFPSSSYPFSELSLQQEDEIGFTFQDNDFGKVFDVFIDHSSDESTWRYSCTFPAIDSSGVTDHGENFNILNVENENVSEDEFELTIPRSISPRYPQIAYSVESVLQRHQRLIREQIRRNEQIANILSPWRKRQQQLQKRKTKRCSIVRRKFSLTAAIDISSTKKPTGKKSGHDQGSSKSHDQLLSMDEDRDQ